MVHLKKGRIIVMLGVFLLVISWQMSPAFAETPKRGGWLTVAVDEAPTGFDPHLSITTATRGFTEHIYECLLRYNYDMGLEPGLATSWEQPDHLTYIFHLRKGVKFHNGSEMTAEDVKFTFDRVTDPKLPLSAFDPVKNTEILDKYTVKVNLKNPMPDFLSYCAFVRDSAIVPKDEVLKQGSLQKVQIGTGPFKLKEYKEGALGTFVRNADYWDRSLPYIDGFKLEVVKDEASRLAGLRKGTYDIGWVREPHIATSASKEPHLRMVKASPARQGRFWLNHKVFPFDNLKLRQAVAACLDRQAIIDKVMFGQAMLSSIIPPSAVPFSLSQEEIAHLPFYRQDYDLAKKLLKEAGYPDGFEFTITTSPRGEYVAHAEIIQQQLSKVGIKAKIKQIEWGAFQKIVRRERNYQANVWGGAWKPDPAGYFYGYMHGRARANETGQNDLEINRLMDLCLTTVDLETRKDYFKLLQYRTAETVTAIMTFAGPSRYEIVNKKVQGYRFMANNGRQYLREAWIEK